MQMPCHCCHVVKRLPMMVLHGTVGKGDVDRITGSLGPCLGPTVMGKAELWAQHTYVVILVSRYCT